MSIISVTADTAVSDVINNPAFAGFGQFIFPIKNKPDFGLGIGTEAEGWINDAVRFWEKYLTYTPLQNSCSF